MYVIYVNYGSGLVFRTGPRSARHRAGVWAHYYKRNHSHCSGCPKCLTRTGLRPIAEVPVGFRAGTMYRWRE